MAGDELDKKILIFFLVRVIELQRTEESHFLVSRGTFRKAKLPDDK
jgi:hypothetical protein